jgi:hypothetical protein
MLTSLFRRTLIFLVTLFFCIEAAAYTTIVERRVVVSSPRVAYCAQPCCARVTWIHEYWVCTSFSEDGLCDRWRLRPGHWVRVYR